MRRLVLLSLLCVGSVRADDDATDDTPVRLTLPARYDASVLCGGGRYLALRLVDGGGVGIVDLVKRELVHTIERPPGDALLAGGRDVLLLISPGTRLVQRYRLDEGGIRRDKVAALPYDGVVELALLGANSAGPLLLGGRRAVLVDVETIEPIDVDGKLIGAWDRYDYTMEVSADGRTFTGIPVGYGAVAHTRMQVDGGRTSLASFGSTSHANRWARPTADGHLVFTPGGGIFGPHLEPARVEWLNDTTCFPTVDPGYFLAVKFVAREGGGFDAHLAICTTADRRVVHTVVGLPEMVPVGNTNSRNSIAHRLAYGEKRYHWVPSVGTLVTLPYDDATVVLRRFSLVESLEGSGASYLFVDSVPPVSTRPGDRYEYRVQARSSGKRVHHEFVDGPEGMTVSRRGVLRWRVPETGATGRHTVVVGLSGADREVFHTFDLVVADRELLDP